MSLKNDLRELQDLWNGFRPARVLLTANNFRIFDYLIKPLSAKELSRKLETDPRATEIVLDCLTSLGLLRKTGPKYRNTAISQKFLVSSSPSYQGNILSHVDCLWKNWSGLDQVLKTGKPFRVCRNHEAFILGMHDIAKLKVKKVFHAINLKGIKKVLDLGGGPGTYALEFARRGMDVTIFDYPETIGIAKRLLKKEKAKINFLEGDFTVEDFGRGYDLIFISQVLHAYDEQVNVKLLRKCVNALNPAGRIIIQEFFISPERTSPRSAALFSINMLVNTEGGRCYSIHEIRSWLEKNGFKRVRHKSIDDSVLIDAVKPGG